MWNLIFFLLKTIFVYSMLAGAFYILSGRVTVNIFLCLMMYFAIKVSLYFLKKLSEKY